MTRRYALEPLADAMAMSLDAACKQLGVSGSTQQEYRQRGVTVRVADRLACQAGFHPALIWPTWHDDALADAEVECAADDCTTRFVPNNPRQRYCQERCYKRQWQRDRYRNDPEWREHKRAQKARYNAETAEYRRRVEQRRYRSDPEKYRAAAWRRYWADPEKYRARTRDRYHADTDQPTQGAA